MDGWRERERKIGLLPRLTLTNNKSPCFTGSAPRLVSVFPAAWSSMISNASDRNSNQHFAIRQEPCEAGMSKFSELSTENLATRLQAYKGFHVQFVTIILCSD